jgi:hypothetical protein
MLKHWSKFKKTIDWKYVGLTWGMITLICTTISLFDPETTLWIEFLMTQIAFFGIFGSIFFREYILFSAFQETSLSTIKTKNMTTRNEIVEELKREQKVRKKVYPRWIQIKKIHEDQAKKRLEKLQAAIDIFEGMTNQEYVTLLKKIEERSKTANTQSSLF